MDMHKNILFVDYENVCKVDLNAIPADVLVPFFFGASQKSVPTDFMRAALKLGERFIPIDVEGQGKNALDFHIAFYLGEHLSKSPEASCIILSKDKGFDPLVKHLAARQFRFCERQRSRRRFRLRRLFEHRPSRPHRPLLQSRQLSRPRSKPPSLYSRRCRCVRGRGNGRG
jgi:PIN domain